MKIASFYKFSAVSAAIIMVSACGSAGDDDLMAWMRNERNSVKPRVTPIPEPSRFQAHQYASEGLAEPFASDRLLGVPLMPQSTPAGQPSLMASELNRRKEPLEAFPLDTMVMVGTLEKKGQLIALLRVNNLLYQVASGQYLGQNFGKIMKISETEVLLREVVQDSAGEWIERAGSLQLQEGPSQ